MRQPTTQTLYSYWNRLRAGRLAPHRLEIEPSRIAAVLSETFMLQRLHADDYRYRLAGTRLCELFGSELRGHNFLEGWNSEDRPTLQRCLASVCEQGAVVVLALAAGDQRRRLELETILLPLLYGNGISRVLGAMSGVSDQWPAREPIGHRRLLRAELLWPDGRKSGLPQRAVLDAPSPAPAGVSAQRRFRVLEGGLGKRE